MFIALVLAIEGPTPFSTCATSHMTPMLFLHVDGLDVAVQIGEPLEGLPAANEVASVRMSISIYTALVYSFKKKTHSAPAELPAPRG